MRAIACDTTLWSDDVWVVDSTPVECGRSRQTAKRSALAGWAQYGYCASHSRYFWGLRLHLVCTLGGLPVVAALTGAKADERLVLLDLLAVEPELVAARPGQVLIADKHYYGRQFERLLCELGLRLLRPARKGEPDRAGAHLFRPLRQVIESINQTFKGQLDLERHGGHTPAGGVVRVLQRHARLDRRDLAQRPHRPADRQVPTRLRSLMAPGIDHLARLTSAIRRRGVDATAREGVDAAPAAGDVEHFKMTDGAGQRGVDQEVISERLEAEHRAEQ
jgi:hypothetical protein